MLSVASKCYGGFIKISCYLSEMCTKDIEDTRSV